MRSHFGCSTCRHRKVKCDEARPVCGPCTRTSRECLSACIFRNYGVDDMQRDAGDPPIRDEDHVWVKLPPGLAFIPVDDPFEETEPTPFQTAAPFEQSRSVSVAVTEELVSPIPVEDEILTAFLLKHYRESPGQWLDCFDSNAYYSVKVAILAATRPLLKASACALAAKHLQRLRQKGSNPVLSITETRNSSLQQTIAGIDLGYESVRLYDQAIYHLKDAIMSPIQDGHFEELFAAVAILCIYELFDSPSTGWRAHLSALSFLYQRTPHGIQPHSALPETLLHISYSVFWSLVRQDCLSAFINETQTRLDLSDLALWRHFGLAATSNGSLLPPPRTHLNMTRIWLEEDMLSNALIWIMCQIINFITNGDGIIPGDFEQPPSQRTNISIPQSDLLNAWRNLEISLDSWYSLLPPSFSPCARKPLALSSLVSGVYCAPEGKEATIDSIVFTVPMCAVSVQTYHMGRILLLMNMPQESTAIWSSVTVRLNTYRRIQSEVVQHAREICGISLAGLPDTIRSHTNPLERQLVVDLLRAVEETLGWATEYRVRELKRQWAGCSTRDGETKA
ncbi:hypothetical protein BJX70DRAFT_385780 [Aspergillus crustosus]